jgi:hypothetical protein
VIGRARAGVIAVIWAAGAVAPAVAIAQARPHAVVELGGGVRLDGGTAVHEQTAEETGPNGARTIFVTRTRLGASAAPDIKIGVGITDILGAEAAFAIGGATLSTEIRGDVEGVPDTTVKESIRRYLVEGGVTASLRRWRRPNWLPFVSAGLTYLRELHEGRTLLETGHAVYAGGGARYLLPTLPGSRVTPGVRVDFRLALVSGGVAVDSGRRVVPTGGAVMFVRF